MRFLHPINLSRTAISSSRAGDDLHAKATLVLDMQAVCKPSADVQCVFQDYMSGHTGNMISITGAQLKFWKSHKPQLLYDNVDLYSLAMT